MPPGQRHEYVLQARVTGRETRQLEPMLTQSLPDGRQRGVGVSDGEGILLAFFANGNDGGSVSQGLVDRIGWCVRVERLAVAQGEIDHMFAAQTGDQLAR